jgi:hypothetical protein
LPIEHVEAFLIHPAAGGGARVDVNGTAIPLDGPMYALLNGIYQRSAYECDIDITFRHTGGRQQNVCRDVIVAHLSGPTIDTARIIAERLRDNTDRRSGLGLLFVIAGREGTNHKILISRFPTDSAIYVNEAARALTVEFLERVFMKNKASYKAVVYEDRSFQAGFWSGRAVDKRLNNPAGQASDYWISDFLLSEFFGDAGSWNATVSRSDKGCCSQIAT